MSFGEAVHLLLALSTSADSVLRVHLCLCVLGAMCLFAEHPNDSLSVICGSEDGTCRIHDSKSGSLLRAFRGHISPIIDLRCVTGKVLTAQQDGVLTVWDSAGVSDETVFRDFDDNSLSSGSQSDSSDVAEAVRILEKYLRQR